MGLPFTGWRTEQLHAITECLSANTRFVILEAPTGIGKSGIGVALRGFSGRRVSILTGTKQLQDQYAGLGAKIIKGRANYDCLLDPEVTAADGVCTVGGLCPHQRGEEGTNDAPACPYYRDKFVALNSRCVAHSYSYFLHEANYAGGFSDPDQILVCDEGHAIDNEVRSFVEVTYYWDSARHVRDPTSHGAWRDYATNQLPLLIEEQRKVQKQMRAQNNPQVAKKLRGINTHISAVQKLLDLDDSWVLTEKEGFRGMTTYSFKPAWTNNYTDQLLFRHGYKTIIMSATILDPELVCLMLGIPVEEATVVRLDSPFNPIQRPLIYKPVMKVSGTYDPAPLVRVIDEIVEDHGDERGIVHTANYKLAKSVMDLTSRQSLFTHTGADRSSALSSFKGMSDDHKTTLVSPSMGTGVDLPHEQLRYQIIAKIPFPDRGDEQIKKRLSVGIHGEDDSSLGSRWYNWQTACSIVQTYGRAMRSENDYGVTYLLDKNWDWWFRQNKGLIPNWVQEAILT